MASRLLIVVLAVLVALLQYRAWFGDAGYFAAQDLADVVEEQRRRGEALGRIEGFDAPRALAAVARQVREQAADADERVEIVVEEEVRDPGPLGMGTAAAEGLGRHVFEGHRLHDLRAGEEHVRRSVDHPDEVREREGIEADWEKNKPGQLFFKKGNNSTLTPEPIMAALRPAGNLPATAEASS